MKNNIEIYFLHGWGFDWRCWDEWKRFINPDISLHFFNRGYFNQTKNDFDLSLSDTFKIVIAHSFGLHYLPSLVFENIDILVLISSFVQFHQYATNLKISQKQIALMKKRILTDPQGLLKDFHSRCGLNDYTISNKNFNTQLLYDDLDMLDNNIIEIDELKTVRQMVLLHDTHDQIVSYAHSEMLNKKLTESKLFLHSGNGHALPLLSPLWCIQSVQAAQSKTILAKETIEQICQSAK